MDREALKSRVREAVAEHGPGAVRVAQQILERPETGFREENTARLVAEWFQGLGLPHRTGLALTGVRADIQGGGTGPTVAVMGELDSLVVPGHPHADADTSAAHACGHHAQIGMMLAVGAALNEPDIKAALHGNIALMAVPAEEFIEIEFRQGLVAQGKLEFMGGKAELVKLGEFDDVDLSMLTHSNSNPPDGLIAVGATNNGVLAKTVRFIGVSAHAGGAPERGVNALKAAMLAMNAIDANRETFRDADSIRVHPIITKGGDVVNAVPSDVRMEMFVRGRSLEAIDDASRKVDRALKAGALALGARVEITNIPSYLPIRNDDGLTAMYRANAESVVGVENVTTATPRGGSTDMGDISHLMPTIQPYAKGASGISHGADFLIHDYQAGVLDPATIMALTVADLLADGATGASQVIGASTPNLTKDRYLELLRSFDNTEVFEGGE